MNKITFCLFLITLCILHTAYSQSDFSVDRFKYVFIYQDISLISGIEDFTGYYGHDLFNLEPILREKLETSGVPMTWDYSTKDCDVVVCRIMTQKDGIGTVFVDCNDQIIFSKQVPFHFKEPLGTIDIPTLTPRVHLVFRGSLDFLDNYRYRYDSTLEKTGLLTKPTDFSFQNFGQYLKLSTDPIEGVYENISFAIPYCVIGIKKEDEKYYMFYIEVEEDWGMENSLIGYFHKNDMDGLEGHWIIKGGQRIMINLEWINDRKLRVKFNDPIADVAIFKKRSE